MKKIIPITAIAILLCLLIGCSGNLSGEFRSSFKEFKESHINKTNLESLFSHSISASKSMDLETMESWFASLEKTEGIINNEMRKGIYRSLKYIQAEKEADSSEIQSDPSLNGQADNDAMLYFVVMSQEVLADDGIL